MKPSAERALDRARPGGMGPLARVLSCLLFGLGGLGPLLIAAGALSAPWGGLSWASAIAARVFAVLTLGGLGAASLTCALLAVFRPAELTGDAVPEAVNRLCPGCGGPRARGRDHTCDGCGLAPDEAPWRRPTAGPIWSLFGAVILGGVGFIGVLILTAMARGSYQIDPSTVFLLLVVITTLAVGVIGPWHYLRAWKTARRERKHYASRPVRFPASGLLVALEADVWVDDAGEVLRAEGSSRWRGTGPEAILEPGPATLEPRSLTWSRQRGEAPRAQLGYRDETGGDPWACEQTSESDVHSGQALPDTSTATRGTSP